MVELTDHRDQDRLERLSLELERNRAEVERLTMLAAAARERMVQARQHLRKLQREITEAIDSLPSRANVRRPRAS
jgi:methylphosphotriester-DNA--protein-cysteine methyltransferase